MDRFSTLLEFCRQLEMDPGELRFVDLRSRSPDALRTPLTRQPRHLGVLTDNDPESSERIASFLRRIDCDFYELYECWTEDSGSFRVRSFDSTHSPQAPRTPPELVLLDRRPDAPIPSEPRPGIEDDTFRQGSDVSMTRRELRLLDLGWLEVQAGHTVWEIGAGTGAISIESARLNPSADYHAVERDDETFELLKKNIRRHETFNVRPHRGWASETLGDLPPPDRVFIGGTCGELSPILSGVDASLQTPGLVLANFLALENIETTREYFEHHGYEVTLKRVSFHESRPLGEGYTRLAEGPCLEMIRARTR